MSANVCNEYLLSELETLKKISSKGKLYPLTSSFVIRLPRNRSIRRELGFKSITFYATKGKWLISGDVQDQWFKGNANDFIQWLKLNNI